MILNNKVVGIGKVDTDERVAETQRGRLSDKPCFLHYCVPWSAWLRGMACGDGDHNFKLSLSMYENNNNVCGGVMKKYWLAEIIKE